ncbi:hypothetical protein SAMN04487926_1605 [Paraburkholderia steynii]|uniref:Uncharacterized protein n=2 Tax=Paraburkholderia steynii TaxID=1245441 RepID=A0A7Z7BLL4_9BURK|nr:hypothetical protein SAMN04487926_1605 [Paraburkholderia steynii]
MALRAKKSREILNCIRDGVDVYLGSVFSEDEVKLIQRNVDSLRIEFSAKKSLISERRGKFRNIVFYEILCERYPWFKYSVDRDGRVKSNLHEFQINGSGPSLLALLFEKQIEIPSELQRRYGESLCDGNLAVQLERLFRDAQLMYPARDTFVRFIDAVKRAISTREPITVVTGICPDYSYVVKEGLVRFTFEHVGDEIGFSGRKFISMIPALSRFMAALESPYSTCIFGADFECLSVSGEGTSIKCASFEFVDKVKRQLKKISMSVSVPVEVSFFFDRVGGEDVWLRRHGQILDRLLQGDYGETGLSGPDVEEIFASRKSLYRAWFSDAEESFLKHLFLKQAAEFALIGEIYDHAFRNFVIFGVDHFKMEPFYSFSKRVPVIYRKMDYT